MMTRISLAVVFGLLVATSLSAVAFVQEDEKQESEAAWFDMDNCAICKNMASMKHDMHKIKWESHMLDNGMISVAKRRIVLWAWSVEVPGSRTLIHRFVIKPRSPRTTGK